MDEVIIEKIKLKLGRIQDKKTEKVPRDEETLGILTMILEYLMIVVIFSFMVHRGHFLISHLVFSVHPIACTEVSCKTFASL
jgi:hypothetical protein